MNLLQGRKYQSLVLAMILFAAVLPASMVGDNSPQEAYAVSGTLDASTCNADGATWDESLSTCTVTGTLEVGSTETLTIPSGATLLIESSGIINAFESAIVVSNGGIIDNSGTISSDRIAFTNNGTISNNGTINIGLGFLLNNPEGTINNEPGGIISNNGNFSNYGTINNEGTIENRFTMDNYDSGIIDNTGAIIDYGTFTGTIPTSGNAIEDPNPPSPAYSMSINSADLSGNRINGVWIVVRPESESGAGLFTPVLFYGEPDVEYAVTVADYGGKVFHHWENGSTERTRTINFVNGSTITAYFDIGDSMRGFAPLTYVGTEKQPELTVNAKSVDGSKSLRMWTIIDPQSSDESVTTYKVYASNYKDRIFDHWEDGSINRIRTLTVDEATTITAYYQTG